MAGVEVEYCLDEAAFKPYNHILAKHKGWNYTDSSRNTAQSIISGHRLEPPVYFTAEYSKRCQTSLQFFFTSNAEGVSSEGKS